MARDGDCANLGGMSRYKKDDWLELGARLLGEEGPGALTVERLTAAARRTRGSFYHHFEDRDAFLRALMARWREAVIDIAGKQYEQAQSAAELRKLMREPPFELDYHFERAVRRFAASEPIVREVLDEVDRKRIEGLACGIAYLYPDEPDPQGYALVQYAVVVGAQWLLTDFDDPRLPAARRAGWRIFRLQEPGDEE
jgi:AcrR family transcriptional regulator